LVDQYEQPIITVTKKNLGKRDEEEKEGNKERTYLLQMNSVPSENPSQQVIME